MVSRKHSGRKRSWRVSRYRPSICVKGLWKVIHKNVRVLFRARVEIRA